MEQEPITPEVWPVTFDQASDARDTLREALNEHHPDVRIGLGVYVVNKEYKVAIRLAEEGQEELAAELAERYIPGMPLDIEFSGARIARALKNARSGQIMRRPGVQRPTDPS